MLLPSKFLFVLIRAYDGLKLGSKMKYEDAIIDAIIDEISNLKNELSIVKRRLDMLQDHIVKSKETFSNSEEVKK